MSRIESKSGEAQLPAWTEDLLAALPPLLTRDLSAKTLGVSKKTIDRRIRVGLLTMVRCGRRVLVPRVALVNYLTRGTS
jgi:excisionase family DNA binding protein